MNERALAALFALSHTRPKTDFRDESFAKQDLFVTDTSRFVAAQCSRRAGKTNGLALKFFKAMDKHPGSLCLYIALTRESARNIMWPVLQEHAEKLQLPIIFTESNLTATHANGSRLQLFGADMKNFIRRLKGIKTPGAAIDEAQDFGAHLQTLVDDVLTPTLTDYEDSWLALTGTPGPVPSGYFYEVTALKRYGFSVHHWTLLDNPYLPNASAFIKELKVKRAWDDRHPSYLREWCNQWVLDTESLLIKYSEDKNHYDELPTIPLVYILGVDIGFRDADALAVIGWSELSQNIYLVEEVVTTGQDITQLSDQIQKMINKYNISKIVMDEGALGKKIAEEIRRRKHIPVQPADKARKMENVAFLNDWLRLGRFKAKANSIFAADSYKIQIDYEKTTPDRLVVKSGHHSDIVDAVLYSFRESPAWTYEEKKRATEYGSREWGDEEAARMEEREEVAAQHAKEILAVESAEQWVW